MKRMYTSILIGGLLLMSQLMVEAQILPSLQQAFYSYQGKVFQEKMYVHTDRDLYLSGELLWFKIYNVNANNHQLEDLSKVAYVEVLGVNNVPVLQAKIALKNGLGSGSFYIPASITNGSYKLRAYTRWMQNAGTAVFFEKSLTLINPQNSARSHEAGKRPVDLQFFGEGGDIISNVKNNIGFKVTGANGKGISLNGVIINQKNDTVARFQTFKFGIGQFNFTPLANQSYKAIARSNDGEIVIKDLPTAKQSGYAMHLVNPDADLLTLHVNTNESAANVYLLVHNGKQINLAVAGTVDGGKTSFQIDQNRLNDGMSHFTVFNEKGQPVSERLFFKKPQSKLDINAKTEFLQYGTRKNVLINWAVANGLSQAEAADLSISIYKVDSLQELDQHDIVSHLYLTSMLKGNVEMPSYYLTNDTKESRLALNHLLITQGWRRMIWNEVLATNEPTMRFLPELNGHLISGKLTDKNEAVKANSDLYMSVPNERLQFYAAKSDDLGNFIINTKDMYGSNEVVMQADSTTNISIRSPFDERYSSFNATDFDWKPTMLPALERRSLNVQVQNLYANDRLKRFYAPNVDSIKFYGSPYKTYSLDDYVRFGTMEEVLREYVSEVLVSKKKEGFALKVVGRYWNLNERPLILLDGVPYFDVNQFMAINPNHIKKLDIVIDNYYYGPKTFEGILSFSSFKSDIAAAEIDPRALVVDYEGMQLQREFYSPAYETEGELASRMPDFRNLLYWSPNLVTNEQGGGQINFYTSDLVGTYMVVMQGLSNRGIPGSKFFSFEVKK